MKVVIRETGRVAGERIAGAYTFFRRLRGLMLNESLQEGNGLHIRPCRSVHTFLMKHAIDVLHLNEAGMIVGMEHRLRPGKIGRAYKGTRSVVELPAGTLARIGAEVGQTAIFEKAEGKPN